MPLPLPPPLPRARVRICTGSLKVVTKVFLRKVLLTAGTLGLIQALAPYSAV